MKKEQSLIKTRVNNMSKIIRFFKQIFAKFNKKDVIVEQPQVEPENKSPLDDVETLKLIMQEKLDIESLDDDTKKRLIVLCKYRLDNIKLKIKDKEKELDAIKSILSEIRELD